MSTIKFIKTWGQLGKANGQFNEPNYLAIASDGNIYVTDRTNNRIQYFDADGKFIGKWGSQGHGDGEFRDPIGIAITPYNEANSSNNKLLIKIMRLIPELASFPSITVNHEFEAGLLSICASYIDEAYIYICDSYNSRIQFFKCIGESNNVKFIGKWGCYGTGNGHFIQPEACKVDSIANGVSIIYVADFNYRIQVFSSDGLNNIRFVYKFGTFGVGDYQFRYPRDFCLIRNCLINPANPVNCKLINQDGISDFKFNKMICIADSDRLVFYIIDESNDHHNNFKITHHWSSPSLGYHIYGLMVDESINGVSMIYVTSDIHCIQKFQVDELNGIKFIKEWGSRDGIDEQFHFPKGIGMGRNGVMYIADSGDNRIVMMNCI